MEMRDDVSKMKSFLRSFGIQVGQEWLGACIDYITEEYSGQIRDPAQLQQKVEEGVFEQYLQSNLYEMYEASSQQEKESEFTLVDELKASGDPHKPHTNTFVLMLKSVRDISKTMEDQIDGLDFSDEKSTNEESDEQEAEERQLYEQSMKKYGSQSQSANNRPKFNYAQNRILYMTVTDGKSDMFAMEFRYNHNLSRDQLVPGVKLAFKNVLIRRGIIMIVPGTMEVLGGSVDDLVKEQNREMENWKRRILGKPLLEEEDQVVQMTQQARRTQVPSQSIRQEHAEQVTLVDEPTDYIPNLEDIEELEDVTKRKSSSTKNHHNDSTNSSISLLDSDSDDDIEIQDTHQQQQHPSSRQPSKKSQFPKWFQP